jgi:hypothetical protein
VRGDLRDWERIRSRWLRWLLLTRIAHQDVLLRRSCCCGPAKEGLALGLGRNNVVVVIVFVVPHDDITFVVSVLFRIVWLCNGSVGHSVVFAIVLLT